MEYEYKVRGRAVRLQADSTAVAVRFSTGSSNSERAMSTLSAGSNAFAKRFDLPNEGISIIPLVQTLGPAALAAEEAIGILKSQAAISNALPVFRIGGNQVIAADRVIVGVDSPEVGPRLMSKYSLTMMREFENKILFQIPDGAEPFALANQISAEVGVRFSEPDFVTVGNHIPQRPTAPVPVIGPVAASPRQYAMVLTKAFEAQALQSGDKNVKIAVLDEGVDTHHPDLKSAIVGSFDAADEDSYQEPNPWDGHGTACAGLAAALGSPVTGVLGAGAGCSLLAVRIAYSQYKGGPWITTNERISRAIAWSWRNGASVLSNSWGGGAPSSAIMEEIDNARTLGRNGLGCVVIIAAGNSFSNVQFPATSDGVVAVAASNEFDEAKTPTSSDGETWWGTCHGREIVVAAPGVHNLTTDISGNSGYASGNYAPTFNGTSSSTPIVAGACALVISANPQLNEKQVRDIIVVGADKVGPYQYNTDGWNEFFGFGRLNVLASVEAALATV